MSRIKYYYDPKTCKYERYQRSKWDIALNSLGFFSLASVIAVVMLISFNYFFESPKELMLKKENQELTLYYQLLEGEVNKLNHMMGDLQQRDDNLYRIIFESEPIPDEMRNAGVGGSDRYKEIKEKGLKQEDLVVSLSQKVDALKRKMYVQSISYDEVTDMAYKKEEYWASVPAIQPILNENLNMLASGYGMRIHPILKVRKMHKGVDFAAPKGTPIYATGDGVVVAVKTVFGGYGKHIEIDHGFGFVTRYAHMNEFKVRKGQKIKRGDLIGTVGNTGSSTAPHVHYEIMKDGRFVNPVNYFFKDLTPEEFDKILELSGRENQSLS
ncbi:peptidoglycan DD-metalloendopeptidase family protein [Aquiflexum gelatinilyticum]|uniref:Peptidoglycan DD-metalloendopeptidase family protein n=1 Tax=Aquiflexum gelatinilyticum TaxID=2961943 RepID=A0A9X2P818_9BACT|nr:peptidoglycan DD-metalloendopeptidase family protein [Aquiflexum gelatinilyticum]MCR9014879.1 peptidoglycan DD-metalloendopeptidase family protein [Aquiflexum gelatinilyticum]MCS4434590.1 peptidoglycan DD-metalloendopeptidase family protein [Aquiflexum gelatinilyticum]